MSDKKIGIALGGGGTRGFAHLGVLKALEEAGIKPNVFSGTSAGAIVGSLLAAGKESDEVFELMKKNKLTDFAKIKLPINGFMSLENMGKKLGKMLPGENFKDLKYPFFAAATNLYTGKIEYISEGNLVQAVQASSSIPIIFSPVEINGYLYVDGGLLDNVPIKPLEEKCDKIIAVEIMPIEEVKEVDKMSEVAERIFHISVKSLNEEKLKNCDLCVRVGGLEGYNILDSSHADEVYEIGYKHAKNLDLEKFKNSI
jgi:NTE family protein